ncbi:sugar ABC transporter substrate-binding protein [Haladaptatus pallidirubidus]|uniref:ABC transporter substrate-binding protein n=1 Tax=Haladaptatus pallidirubidus TaxID=1008152 RepID=A0AAV3URY9_9EURY|nr:sugar ABC transporter substrate-binding protein [Haladaptatus pallidirubidus]
MTALGMAGLSGYTSQDGSLTVGLSTHFTSGAWVTAVVEATQFYAQDQGFNYNLFTTGGESQKQITDIRQMVNQNYDGIVLIPFNSQAIGSVVEEATNAGVPVFTVDIDAATGADKMHFSWDDEAATRRAGEMLVENLRQQKPNQDQYQVLEVRAPPGRDIARLRHEPFVNLIEQTDDVIVAGTVVGDWVRETSKQRTPEWINANQPPDAIYSANFLMSLGALSALQEMDLAVPRGEDGHIVMTQLDGSQNTHEMIMEGFIDGAVDQPNYYYGPLALAYLERFVNQGESALPSQGSTVTSTKEPVTGTGNQTTTTANGGGGQTVTIEPAQHRGVELWQAPIWSPATIRQAFNHRQFVTSHVEITEENADAPYLWGNIWGPDASIQ